MRIIELYSIRNFMQRVIENPNIPVLTLFGSLAYCHDVAKFQNSCVEMEPELENFVLRQHKFVFFREYGKNPMH
jgi:hypothetical protein